eukprot:CAMPEP_0168535982 /NCGR_PEP_ID=MMETSP0405-20121227/19182_1 /TAXON_ID=498012 /ORGANISM="Trichosphaerium sp, Strain Am-I-7 wt" /LENGTH=443 /DNA_ID=CAMNT_0008563709 /DNA_START=23 /DNA_END=1354 /DNA_ORIENTATION=-
MALQKQWGEFVAMKYADQGKAFLNAFWDELPEDIPEKVWQWAAKFAELDLDKQEEGCDLDEFGAHRFLEAIKEASTVKAMREDIKEADIDFNKRLALIEFCLWKLKKKASVFCERPQGDADKIAKMQAALEAAQAALQEAIAKAKAARESESAAAAAATEAKKRADEAAAAEAKAKDAAEKAKRQEDEAKCAADEAAAAEAVAAESAAAALAKEEEAKKPADEARAAEDELRAALAELEAQETAYKNKTEDLKKRSEQGGVVTRNKAKAELEIHLAEDPLPLRTAKITQEAATRKAEKARKIADEYHAAAVEKRKAADEDHAAAAKAREAADYAASEATASREASEAAAAAASQARQEADDAKKEADEAHAAAAAARAAGAAARAEADSALDDAQAKVAIVEEQIVEAKKNAGPGKGLVWWIERELHEAKKYMPLKKGGILRK